MKYLRRDPFGPSAAAAETRHPRLCSAEVNFALKASAMAPSLSHEAENCSRKKSHIHFCRHRPFCYLHNANTLKELNTEKSSLEESRRSMLAKPQISKIKP